MKVVIIDDEQPARDIVKLFLTERDDIEIAGVAKNGFEGIKLISEVKPDLIFLDIQMPKIDGFEMLELIDNPPAVIFCTAYDEYALKAFEHKAVDYLLKPITIDRFLKAVNKANEFFQLKNTINGPRLKNGNQDYFFIKCDSKYEKIYFDEILYIQALQNYVTIHTPSKKYTSLLTLK